SLVSERSGKYGAAAKAGRLFSIANQGAVATVAALATTGWTGLAVGNPTGSGIKIIMLQFGISNEVIAQKEGVIGLMVSATSLTASLTPLNRRPGGVASGAYATEGQTLVAPVLYDVCGSYDKTNTNLTAASNAQVYDIDGSLILDEGQCVAAFFTLDSTAALMMSFLWEERDA
ncbi:unnamed protein product, partial [marine sediment metagenome]